MENQYYLRIEDNNFGFVLKGFHDIEETDIKITNDDYDLFFNQQSTGSQFKLKDVPDGNGLFGFVEKYIPKVVKEEIAAPSDEERIAALEALMLEVIQNV